MIELRPFQRRFLAGATADGVDTAVLSLPRGNGKSWIAGHIVARVLSPDDVLFRPGTESVLCAASMEQARVVFRFARAMLAEGAGGYRFQDAGHRIGILHPATNTRLRVISSSGKRAMGLVDCPWVIGDEPGSWEVNAGTLMHDAIETAKGKPGSPLRAIYIGTLAPATAGWWHSLVDKGSRGSVYVQALRGDPAKWDQWLEIRRCNPLTAIDGRFRAKLREEREEALVDPRLKARFMSYRLNVPSADESTMLLTVPEWERACGRAVPAREGKPIIGIDLGAGRAWSAATAIWKNGRVEALAISPGVPDLVSQEKRDRVPAGTYRKLVDAGLLRLADGLRVPPVTMLWNAALEAFGPPEALIADRFRLPELQDAVRGRARVISRMARWSEAAADIRALRKMVLDGPMAPVEASRPLLAASLAASMVKNDDQGSVRMVKRDPFHSTGRDDVASALVLAAGLVSRTATRTKPAWRYAGMAA